MIGDISTVKKKPNPNDTNMNEIMMSKNINFDTPFNISFLELPKSKQSTEQNQNTVIDQNPP